MYVTILLSNHRRSHIPSSWLVHAGCVFVAGIHLSGHECQNLVMRWNACVHRLELGVYTHPREF